MRAWFACSANRLITRSTQDTVGRLASAQQAKGLLGSVQQEAAWQVQVPLLRKALKTLNCQGWFVALEFDLIRLEKRIDTVLLTDRAIIVFEFKSESARSALLAEVEDYALDLKDFHAGSQKHPIVPVLVGGEGDFIAPIERTDNRNPWSPLSCGEAGIAEVITWIQSQIPPPKTPLRGERWLEAPYKPVATIIEAATALYSQHSVAEIEEARSDTANLTRTAKAIKRSIKEARKNKSKVVIFVTGIPGAGKTLCGLNTVFGHAKQDGAAFLTGNVPLVSVLREALIRDAVQRKVCDRRTAKQDVEGTLQNVHRFLEDYAPKKKRRAHERVIVFDEAQRAWDQAKARTGTQNRKSKLTRSEPAHTLEIMARRKGWSAIVALIGGGQEINTGEAGLAEWGRVIQADPQWKAVAAPSVLTAQDKVQRLADDEKPWLQLDPDLDLVVEIRNVREGVGAPWVNALLEGKFAEARGIAEAGHGVPYFVTRDLDSMRSALRRLARGQRRAGIVRSSGAKRLRAEGLGSEIESKEVPDWFLNRWPDVRASDALECAATEYACQGLELDYVGVAWGGDFLLRPQKVWHARNFVGTAWSKAEKDFHFIRNTYRVLLTRARYETVIWVPRGDSTDVTRRPQEMNHIAQHLLDCGAKKLDELGD